MSDDFRRSETSQPVNGNGLPPIVAEIIPAPHVGDALCALRGRPGVVLFDSALRRGELGRYSYLSAEPVRTWVVDDPLYGSDPFAAVRQGLAEVRGTMVAGLPPFQGGAVGMLSYELGGCWERLPPPHHREFAVPAMVVGLYDWVLAWDHLQGRAWVIVQPFAEEPRRRIEDVQSLLQRGNGGAVSHRPLTPGPSPQRGEGGHAMGDNPGSAGATSNMTRDEYLAHVRRVIEYIRAGTSSRRTCRDELTADVALAPVELYLRLREVNPAPSPVTSPTMTGPC